MRAVLISFIKRQFYFVGCVLGASLCVQAQVANPGLTMPAARAQPITVSQSSSSNPPQVVTVVHRLSGMKVLSLLYLGGQSPTVVGDEFVTARDMLTSVTAGFALGDGKSVVARLPQAEAAFFWPTVTTPSVPPTPTSQPATPASVTASTFPKLPELQVIQRDGVARNARYIGMDAGTGLSLLQIENLNSSAMPRDAVEAELAIGQRVRLVAPKRVNSPTTLHTNNPATGKVYLALGELEGQIIGLKRSSSGKLAHIIIRAPNLMSAFTGGIALNEAGQTIGIVEAGKTRVMPIAVVRRAIERILTRGGNVPQPWLGIRGQAIAATPLAQLLARGWTPAEADLLRAKQSGLLLTTVAPNTPAAMSNLRSGDVIVKLNEDEIKSSEDFSFMLNEAGSGAIVNLTVLRKTQVKMSPSFTTPTPVPLNVKPLELSPPVIVSVKLSESLNPVRSIREAETMWPTTTTNSLLAAGIETIPLSPKAATRLGVRGGLLVIYVGQESVATRAGLLPFDIIESVNGQLLTQSSLTTLFNSNNTQPKNLIVVRDGQKFSFSFSFSAPEKKKR